MGHGQAGDGAAGLGQPALAALGETTGPRRARSASGRAKAGAKEKRAGGIRIVESDGRFRLVAEYVRLRRGVSRVEEFRGSGGETEFRKLMKQAGQVMERARAIGETLGVEVDVQDVLACIRERYTARSKPWELPWLLKDDLKEFLEGKVITAEKLKGYTFPEAAYKTGVTSQEGSNVPYAHWRDALRFRVADVRVASDPESLARVRQAQPYDWQFKRFVELFELFGLVDDRDLSELKGYLAELREVKQAKGLPWQEEGPPLRRLRREQPLRVEQPQLQVPDDEF